MSDQPTTTIATPPPPKTSSGPGSGSPAEVNPFSDEQAQPASPAAAAPSATVPPTVDAPAVSSPGLEPAAPPAPASPTPPPSTPPVATNERTGPIDHRVSPLLAMFPDFDEAVMVSVLQTVNWDQDRAVEILLGMSDPDYRAPPEEQQAAPLTQEQLDEQFARQLVLQEQEAHARAISQYEHQSQGRGAGAPRPDDPRYQPHRRTSQSSQPPRQNEPDPVAEIGQQLKEGFEVGKKTLGGWFSKAKDKLNELDQQRQQPAAGTSSPPQQPWGHNPGDHSYASYQPAHGQPSATSQQPAFYDPNPTSPVSPIERQPAPTGRPSIDGGKIGVLPRRPVSLIADDTTNPITLEDKTTSPGPKAQTTGGAGAGAASGSAAQAPATTAAAPTAAKNRDDDDELEYADNPFEDDHRR